MKRLLIAFSVLALSSVIALAGSGWHKVGEFDSGGDGKEVAVDRTCSQCLIKVKEGSVIINTITVREGGNKTPHKIGKRLNKGEDEVVQIGDKIPVKSMRIGDDGRGHYEVYVK